MENIIKRDTNSGQILFTFSDNEFEAKRVLAKHSTELPRLDRDIVVLLNTTQNLYFVLFFCKNWHGKGAGYNTITIPDWRENMEGFTAFNLLIKKGDYRERLGQLGDKLMEAFEMITIEYNEQIAKDYLNGIGGDILADIEAAIKITEIPIN